MTQLFAEKIRVIFLQPEFFEDVVDIRTVARKSPAFEKINQILVCRGLLHTEHAVKRIVGMIFEPHLFCYRVYPDLCEKFVVRSP